MFKRIGVLSFILFLMVSAFVACGGGGGSFSGGNGGGGTPGVAAKPMAFMRAGMAMFKPQTTSAGTTNPLSSIVPSVSAATPISLQQSFQGTCITTPNVGQIIHLALYQVGQNNSPNCQHWTFGDNAMIAAMNATQGQLLVGAGSIGSLVVWTSPGTALSDPVPIRIFISRNGSVIDSGLACSLPTGSGYLKCDSGLVTAQGLDGDFAILIATLPFRDDNLDTNNDNHITNLNAVFIKTL